ncbi:Muscle M-line assembly unc- isoform 1 isoform A [Chlorella sorokiniana]|uniref:Muscle M-line assembly unc-isoform 1 isoform A n=1 Tax=Chlorella sorokiniana TaxID=3076 RepID=A0A2P6TR39_CHLSO|nr:Muscle M-line assembly unc- isoform 1 isoform A [Chlorella sorokiniana]|eukprot:PRW56527.1 Muscle M-line assembly unc- isoform 1 isoform A [Chlorella sorokiniana]
MSPASALLQPAGAPGALASTSGRSLAPLAPQQPPSPCPSGRRRRLAPPPLRAQSVGYEGRQAAAAQSGSPRPFGVPPGSFVQQRGQRGPPVVPQRVPVPVPLPPSPQNPVQQHQAATAAALAAQRQAQQAALLAAQQQQQQGGQQLPPSLKQLKQQQQQQQQGPPGPAAASSSAAAHQQQAAPAGPAAAAQPPPMPSETLAAINRMVTNARKANARAKAAALDVDEQERLRRLKISQANKGRTPWNKGRRHSPETIARIRAATKVAMQRADVRERLQKANEKRVPHSSEAKEKIRVKLQERADKAREQINAQAEAIVARLQASEDPSWREAGEYEHAVDVVAGLAWQFFKKDWSDVSTKGWDEHPEFAQRCIHKLLSLVEKKRLAAVPKKRKVDKVKKALDTLKKLQQARGKAEDAEGMLEQLRRAKEHPVFASDPDKLAGLEEAEAKADAVLSKLRKQVDKLESALQPLQEFLDAELAADEDGAAHISLEERLEADAAARQAAAEAAAEEAAVDTAASSSSGGASEEDGSDDEASSGGSGAGLEEGGASSGHTGVNGYAAPAARARTTLPWQQ